MKIRCQPGSWAKADEFGTLLYDLERDPGQREPLQDRAVEHHMTEMLIRLMREDDSPPEQFERLGLNANPERIP